MSVFFLGFKYSTFCKHKYAVGIDNKIFCTAPFTTMRIESYSPESPTASKDFGVIFKPGCVYMPDKPCGSLDEYLHGADMEDHRYNLLHGHSPRSNCELCSGPESQGMTSIRKQLLKKPWASDSKNIKMLDVGFGNTCNLGCLMCVPECSSYIANERRSVGLLNYTIKHKNNIELALHVIDQLPDLESVSFIGGEVFLVDQNIKILEKIQQRGITATIMTNGTVINQPMIDSLKQIKSVEIRISVDGVGSGFEFIRYPAVWTQWQSNVYYLRQQLPHADISCSAVFQLLNCQQIHELYEWANQQRLRLNHQLLQRPDYLRFQILTDTERNTLVEYLKNKQHQKFLLARHQQQVIDNLITMISQLEHDPGLRAQFVNFISLLGIRRNWNADIINNQFGVLQVLANEVIDAMDFAKRSFILHQKNV